MHGLVLTDIAIVRAECTAILNQAVVDYCKENFFQLSFELKSKTREEATFKKYRTPMTQCDGW